MKNMVVENTKVRKFLGYEFIGEDSLPLTGNGMEIINYTDARGTKHMIGLTTSDAYLYNASNDEWDKITPLNTSAPAWLIGHWKMNDDAATKVVVDSSANGNDGTAQQNTEDINVTGKINGALSFNGTSD
jgi:hypothetical protein